jgi:hypothetical protein
MENSQIMRPQKRLVSKKVCLHPVSSIINNMIYRLVLNNLILTNIEHI